MTGTILLRGIAPNQEKMLWPGQFVHISLNLYELPDAVLVPDSAIGKDTKGNYLFTAKQDGTVELRRVTLGQRHGQQIVVEKGVKAGEQVVSDGISQLYPGAKYKVKK